MHALCLWSDLLNTKNWLVLVENIFSCLAYSVYLVNPETRWILGSLKYHMTLSVSVWTLTAHVSFSTWHHFNSVHVGVCVCVCVVCRVWSPSNHLLIPYAGVIPDTQHVKSNSQEFVQNCCVQTLLPCKWSYLKCSSIALGFMWQSSVK